MDTSIGAPGPVRGVGQPSSSVAKRIDFGNEPHSEPPILRESETSADGLTGPLITSQG
jgi:hypothetical protein